MKTLPPIRFKTFIAAPPPRIFEVLTTARGWDSWFTSGATLDARVGGTLEMRWVGASEAQHRVTLWGSGHGEAAFRCPIVAFEPDRRFAFRWQTGATPTTVTFDLTARGAGTVVELTDDGYDADALGKAGPTGEITGASPYTTCASGWGEALTLLKMFVEHGVAYGPVPPPWRDDREGIQSDADMTTIGPEPSALTRTCVRTVANPGALYWTSMSSHA